VSTNFILFGVALWLSLGFKGLTERLLIAVSKYTVSQKTAPFLFEHNFRKFPILIILSLLRTEIICPKYVPVNWIYHFTYGFVAACITSKNATAYTPSQTLLNKTAMHATILLLLQSRKFWWYLLLTVFFDPALRRHNDVILLQYFLLPRWLPATSMLAIHRVSGSGSDFVFQQDSAPHTAPCTCNSWTAASRNAKLSCAQPVASKQPRSQSCGLRDLGCHAASCLPQTNP